MVAKKGQVWVETVIYTLIGLTLIGIILAIVIPKVNESQDRIAIEQSIESLQTFDSKINEVVQSGPGNVRRIESFVLRRGEMYINSSNESIVIYIPEIETPYSEPGTQIEYGDIGVLSEEGQRDSRVFLKLDYQGEIDLFYDGEESDEKFSASTVPYVFTIENVGSVDGIIRIDIEEVSGG